ncbi:hypothetical protein [Streptomyces tauricus]|uniref:hypothetical protein n=1 Tax=Streptomyces tauricus TaxID=68274 RepID=UPI0038B5BBA5
MSRRRVAAGPAVVRGVALILAAAALLGVASLLDDYLARLSRTRPQPAHGGNGHYGKATTQAWDRLHPRLTRWAAWLGHEGPLPIIEGIVVRLVVEKLPSGGVNKPVW